MAVTAAAVGGTSGPVNAVIEGVLGGGGLVPFVYHGTFGSTSISINTFVALKLPDFAGIDTVPNLYTAPYVTPNPSQNPNNPSCNKANGHSCDFIRWFFFDAMSSKGPDGTIPMSADDLEIFDWAAVAPGLVDKIGYLVFTTQAGANGQEANFAFATEAAMTFTTPGGNTFVLHVPALPMSDGADDGNPNPELGNEIVANLGNPVPANGVVTAVSPLAAGIRLANGGGDGLDITRINMTLGQRNWMDHLMVVWLDGNYDLTGADRAIVDVWSEDEDHCSSSVPLPYELNLIWVESYGSGTTTQTGLGLTDTRKDPLTAHLGKVVKHADGIERIADDDTSGSVCIPAGKEVTDLDGIRPGGPGGVGNNANGWFPFEQRGVVQLSLEEVHDITGLGRSVLGVDLGTTSSAGVAFMMYFSYDAIDYNKSPNNFANGGGLDLGNDNLIQAGSEHAVDLGKEDRVPLGQ